MARKLLIEEAMLKSREANHIEFNTDPELVWASSSESDSWRAVTVTAEKNVAIVINRKYPSCSSEPFFSTAGIARGVRYVDAMSRVNIPLSHMPFKAFEKSSSKHAIPKSGGTR